MAAWKHLEEWLQAHCAQQPEVRSCHLQIGVDTLKKRLLCLSLVGDLLGHSCRSEQLPLELERLRDYLSSNSSAMALVRSALTRRTSLNPDNLASTDHCRIQNDSTGSGLLQCPESDPVIETLQIDGHPPQSTSEVIFILHQSREHAVNRPWV